MARPKARQVEGGYARRGERQGGEGKGVEGWQRVEDDKESSEDAQMTRERERVSGGNSLGETHCRRNVNSNY